MPLVLAAHGNANEPSISVVSSVRLEKIVVLEEDDVVPI